MLYIHTILSLVLCTPLPGTVYYYRHPLEVALSLQRRSGTKESQAAHGHLRLGVAEWLDLWMLYNRRAIQSSQSMCRVESSNEAILANPLQEARRISDELVRKCQMVSPPQYVTQDGIGQFVNPALQHNKNDGVNETLEVLMEYNGCVVHVYASNLTQALDKKRELELYKAAMKMYCDFQSGRAYKSDYEWPR